MATTLALSPDSNSVLVTIPTQPNGIPFGLNQLSYNVNNSGDIVLTGISGGQLYNFGAIPLSSINGGITLDAFKTLFQGFFHNASGGAGSTVVDFNQSIPFNYGSAIMNKTVDGPLTFTPNNTGRKAGDTTTLRLVADGVNEPVFSGFKKLSSEAYDNTADRAHIIIFLFNGVNYNYSISLAEIVDSTPPTVTDLTATDAHTIVATFSEVVLGDADGWSFKQNGSDIVVTEVTGNGTDQFEFIFAETLLTTDVLLCSYDKVTGNVVDTSGNALESFTNIVVNSFIFIDNFNAADTGNISGRVTPVGLKTWQTINTNPGANIGIASNAAKAVMGFDVINTYYIECGKTDIELTAVLASIQSSSPGLYLKVSSVDVNNYIHIKTSSLQVYQYAGGVGTLLSAGSGLTTVGQEIKVVLLGDQLSTYRDGVLVATVTVDVTTNPGTKVGMFMYQDTDSSLDLIQAK